MSFFVQNSLIYPKLQHNKECFTKLWIVICKGLSIYEIMPKISCFTYPKFQSKKDRFTKLWIIICKSLSKHESMKKIITKYFADPELYTKNAIFGPNLPHLPNFWRLPYFFQKIFKSPHFLS